MTAQALEALAPRDLATLRIRREAVATYLKYARRTMRKRVWVPTGTQAKLREVQDGAIPCWWIDQEIARLELPILATGE